MKNLPIVLVSWIDSSARHGWRDKSENNIWSLKDLECTSVGFVLQDDKDVLVLVMGYSPEQWDTIMTIPRSVIKKIVKLKWKN